MKAIGLDLDGTLYNWHCAVYENYKLNSDFNGTYDKFWLEITPTFSNEQWEFITNIDFLYSSQLPTPDCVNFISNIRDRFNIFYITSRPKLVKTTTEQYLRRYDFPFLDNLFFTDDKVNTARLLQLHYFIEDMPHHVEKLSSVTNVIMMAQHWNKHLWGKYTTVHSLTSALQYLED